jgi:predicted RNA-binding protein with PIN domain
MDCRHRKGMTKHKGNAFIFAASEHAENEDSISFKRSIYRKRELIPMATWYKQRKWPTEFARKRIDSSTKTSVAMENITEFFLNITATFRLTEFTVMLLIDGHNIMYRIPALAHQLRAGDSEAARRAFEQCLCAVRDGHIFYDGGPGGRAQTLKRANLLVTYAGHTSADNALVSFAHAHQHRQLTAATGDRDLQLRLRAAGCTIMAPDRLFNRFYRDPTVKNHQQAQQDAYADRMKNHRPNAQETQQWLEAFQRHAAAKRNREG